MGDVTRLIEAARGGDKAAIDRLFQQVYPDLRRIAHSRLRRGLPDADFGTTQLLHDCYLRLRDVERLDVGDRQHFFAYAASAMRSIVVDAARARSAQRRGGEAAHVTFDEDRLEGAGAEDAVLRVHEALEEVAKIDARLARLVELRYFAGFDDEEVARALDVSVRTVQRDWQKARMLLATALA